MLTNSDAMAATIAISTRLNTFMFSLAMSTVTRPGSPCFVVRAWPYRYTTRPQEPHVTQMRNLTCCSYVVLIVDTRNITVGPQPGNVRSQLLTRALPDLPLCSLPSRGRRSCAGAETGPSRTKFCSARQRPKRAATQSDTAAALQRVKSQLTDGAEGCFPATNDHVLRRRQARIRRGLQGTWAATPRRRSC